MEEKRKGGRISRRELDNLASASCTGVRRDETTTLGHIATNVRLFSEMPLSLQRKSTKTNNNRKQKRMIQEQATGLRAPKKPENRRLYNRLARRFGTIGKQNSTIWQRCLYLLFGLAVLCERTVRAFQKRFVRH